uniref:Uncharacterized protein n=1 Tax=Amphora coffeiformis TaxID=265554 RepID=A0A7S3LC14_9STRA
MAGNGIPMALLLRLFCGYGSSFLNKLWSANRVIRPFRRANINERHDDVALASMLGLNFVFLLRWTLINPLEWTVQSVPQDEPWNLYGACRQEGTAGWGIACFGSHYRFCGALGGIVSGIQSSQYRPGSQR